MTLSPTVANILSIIAALDSAVKKNANINIKIFFVILSRAESWRFYSSKWNELYSKH